MGMMTEVCTEAEIERQKSLLENAVITGKDRQTKLKGVRQAGLKRDKS